MTDQPPRGATPDDIEAALQHVRAGLDAASMPPPLVPREERPVRRGPSWRSVGVMMVVVAGIAAAIAILLPRYLPLDTASDDGIRRRLTALEARATRPDEASQTATSRLDAIEARVRVLEDNAGKAVAPPPAASSDMTARLDALAQSIADLEARFGVLAQQVAALPVTPAAPPMPAPAPVTPPPSDIAAAAELTAQIDALSGSLAALEQRVTAMAAATPDQALITALDRRISELEDADPGAAARNAAMALAISRLQAAADTGRGFRVELEALKLVAPSLDTTAFEPYAANGLTTIAGLADWLGGIDGAIRDGADADRGGDWFDRLWRGLGSLVTVRPAGEPSGSDPEDHVLRAERRLEKNDLAAAVKEIEALTGAARAPAEAWLIDARARLALDAALAQLTAKILADLARP